jgi:hypothetical protein
LREPWAVHVVGSGPGAAAASTGADVVVALEDREDWAGALSAAGATAGFCACGSTLGVVALATDTGAGVGLDPHAAEATQNTMDIANLFDV